MSPLLTALHFLTTIPLLPKRNFSDEEFGRAVSFFPLVGAIIGGILAGIYYVMVFFFPDFVIAALILGFWLLLTGALHLDGLLDSVDGLLGGYDQDSRLKIMKDQRVGAFGFAAGASLLLLKFAMLVSILTSQQAIPALLLTPTIARWNLSIAIAAFPYARERGLGRGVKNFTTWKQVVLATVTALLMALLVSQWMGMIVMGISVLIVWLCAQFSIQRISGLTGDVYGAIVEIIEAVVLLLFVFQWP